MKRCTEIDCLIFRMVRKGGISAEEIQIVIDYFLEKTNIILEEIYYEPQWRDEFISHIHMAIIEMAHNVDVRRINTIKPGRTWEDAFITLIRLIAIDYFEYEHEMNDPDVFEDIDDYDFKYTPNLEDTMFMNECIENIFNFKRQKRKNTILFIDWVLNGYTYRELGEMYGISTERARQIKCKCIRVIRKTNSDIVKRRRKEYLNNPKNRNEYPVFRSEKFLYPSYFDYREPKVEILINGHIDTIDLRGRPSIDPDIYKLFEIMIRESVEVIARSNIIMLNRCGYNYYNSEAYRANKNALDRVLDMSVDIGKWWRKGWEP